MSTLAPIRSMEESDIPAVTELLVRAYDGDPGYSALFPDEHRSCMLRFLMTRLLRMRLDSGTTIWLIEDEGVPVATLSFGLDRCSFFGWATYLRHGLLTMPLRFGLEPVRCMLEAEQLADGLRRKHAPRGRYVWFAQLAADPNGRATWNPVHLASAALAKVDAQRLPAATMTTRWELVQLYQRWGFEERGRVRCPEGFVTWFLVREPRA